MLKPTLMKDCCWHNVSQHSALGRVCQERNSTVAGDHKDYDPALVGFGEPYYDRLSQLIDKHLELRTDDCICYVGDARGALVVPVLMEQYCLVKPVTQVNPYLSSSDGTSQQMDQVFAYQFSGLKSELYFDKIIVYISIHLFSDIITELLRFINALTDRGRLLIIHRPFRLNTLPFPADVLDQLRSADLSLEHLISTIQLLGLEFHWEVENSKVVTSRQKWLDIIQYGGFPQCKQDQETQASDNPDRTSDGVCKLMNGVLRYAGNSDIEFVDRMVFVTVNRASPVPTTQNLATVTRSLNSKNKVNTFGRLEMEVTPEIEELLNARKQQQQKKRILFD